MKLGVNFPFCFFLSLAVNFLKLFDSVTRQPVIGFSQIKSNSNQSNPAQSSLTQLNPIESSSVPYYLLATIGFIISKTINSCSSRIKRIWGWMDRLKYVLLVFTYSVHKEHWYAIRFTIWRIRCMSGFVWVKFLGSQWNSRKLIIMAFTTIDFEHPQNQLPCDSSVGFWMTRCSIGHT